VGLGAVLHKSGVTLSIIGAEVISKLYNCLGWAVLYPSKLVFGAPVAISVPIWFELQSAVVGGFKTIVAVAGGFAIAVGEAVVCAVARFSWRCCFFSALLEAVSAAALTDSAEAGCSGVSAVVGLVLASRAITAALNALNVLSISGGKRIPSSLGQSCSLWLVCSSSSRVPVSGSKAVGEAAGRFSTVVVVDIVVMREAACSSRVRIFFAAFLQIVSMVAEKGKCRSQRLRTETTCGQQAVSEGCSW
jgi:hypothetical protein